MASDAEKFARLKKLLKESRQRLAQAENATVVVQERIRKLQKKSVAADATFRELDDQLEELMREGTTLDRLDMKDSEAFQKLKRQAVKKRKQEDDALNERDRLQGEAKTLERTELKKAFDNQDKAQAAVDRVLELLSR